MALDLSDELRGLLALHLLPGLGPLRTAVLLEHFGSADAVLRASAADLAGVQGIGPKLSAALVEARAGIDLDGELALMEKHGVRPVARTGARYPAPLSEIYDPPCFLYLRGGLTAADVNAVAIVGSRNCTDYGKRMATRLGGELARSGYTVISGL